jgi:membrane associated rhomboid family serine protease
MVIHEMGNYEYKNKNGITPRDYGQCSRWIHSINVQYSGSSCAISGLCMYSGLTLLFLRSQIFNKRIFGALLASAPFLQLNEKNIDVFGHAGGSAGGLAYFTFEIIGKKCLRIG